MAQYQDHLASPLRRDPRLIFNALRYAGRQIGTPYSWGGSSPGGFDCSGLVYWAYRKAGYSGIGRTTYDQIKQGIPVSQAGLKPGDIVFPTPHHEGLYVGNGMVLEAPHTGDRVKLIPLSSFGFWQARRLVRGGGGIIPPRGIGGMNGLGLPTASPNPQDRMPHPAYAQQLGQLQQQNLAAMAAFKNQFQAQQADFTKQLAEQAAQSRQQSLTDTIQAEAKQRADAARMSQQALNGGLPQNASDNPSANLLEQRKLRLTDIHTQALQRAGIL